MNSFITTVKSELTSLDTSTNQLRKFGLLVAAISLAFLGFALYAKGIGSTHYFLILIGGLAVFSAIFLPRLLLLPYYLWMGIAIVLGFFVGEIMLTILFFLVVSPMAIIRRLFRKGGSGKEQTNWVTIVGVQASQKMDRLF